MIKNSSKPSDGFTESSSSRPMTLRQQLEEQFVTAFKLGLMDGTSTSRSKPDPLPALRSVLNKAEELFERYGQEIAREARCDTIDKVFEMSPGKSFNQWQPIDALRFYERLKAYEQELTQKPPQPPQGDSEKPS